MVHVVRGRETNALLLIRPPVLATSLTYLAQFKSVHSFQVLIEVYCYASKKKRYTAMWEVLIYNGKVVSVVTVSTFLAEDFLASS